MKDYSEIKRWLGRLRFQEARIEAESEQIERLRALTEKVTASCGAGGGGGSCQDHRYDLVAQVIDGQRELDDRMRELMRTEKEIRNVIAAVPEERMRVLLELRYIAHRSWERVAAAMGYEERQVHRIHAEALRRIAELGLIDEEVSKCHSMSD